MKLILRLICYLWASPASLLGMAIGGLGMLTRGRARTKAHILEFHSGAVGWLLRHFPGDPLAMTLGHVVIARTEAALDITHEHEMVHVRQYERWGPLFIPAYLACSLVLWLRRRDPYRDNPFEVEAYSVAP